MTFQVDKDGRIVTAYAIAGTPRHTVPPLPPPTRQYSQALGRYVELPESQATTKEKEMENQLHSRHGDLVFKLAPIPADIELSEQKAPIILAGRESAPHAIADFQHVLYGRREGIQYLRVAEHVEVSHSERHKTIPLQPGDYQVASLAEMDGDMARAVDD